MQCPYMYSKKFCQPQEKGLKLLAQVSRSSSPMIMKKHNMKDATHRKLFPLSNKLIAFYFADGSGKYSLHILYIKDSL
jgi:hypothetical protein